MELIVAALLMLAIIVLLMYSNSDYRQGWRNSKFIDELKNSGKTERDLIDPDKQEQHEQRVHVKRGQNPYC